MNDAAHDPDSALLRFRLHHDAWGRLVLIDADGQQFENVAATAMFPLSDPEHWISLRCGGREIANVEDPEQLPAASRDVLAEELSRRAFVPRLTRILHVSGYTEPCEWQVETDRGPTRLLLNSEDDIRRLSAHQVLVVDAHGVRYLIPDLRALDAKSRRIIQWYV